MREMSLREARAKLGELAEAAHHGDPTILSKHGKPYARIAPLEDTVTATPELQPIQFNRAELNTLMDAIRAYSYKLTDDRKATDDPELQATYRDLQRKLSAVTSRINILVYDNDPTEPGYDDNA